MQIKKSDMKLICKDDSDIITFAKFCDILQKEQTENFNVVVVCGKDLVVKLLQYFLPLNELDIVEYDCEYENEYYVTWFENGLFVEKAKSDTTGHYLGCAADKVYFQNDCFEGIKASIDSLEYVNFDII